MSENVKVAVIGPKLEQLMFWAVPLIEHFLHKIFVIVQLKAKWSLVGLATGVTLNVQLYGHIFDLGVILARASVLVDKYQNPHNQEECCSCDTPSFHRASQIQCRDAQSRDENDDALRPIHCYFFFCIFILAHLARCAAAIRARAAALIVRGPLPRPVAFPDPVLRIALTFWSLPICSSMD
jgi:hypothetical protein